MNKKIIKYSLIGLFAIFLILYFFGSNIYQNWTTEKKILTEEQIMKFEQDIKDGKEIDMDEYIVKEKSYDNTVTNINAKISNIIEESFKKIFKYLLKNIDV